MKCVVLTNAEILYQCKTELNCFNEEEENTIYRIIQEAITKILFDMEKQNKYKLILTENIVICLKYVSEIMVLAVSISKRIWIISYGGTA